MLVQFLLCRFTRSHGKFSVCFSVPKTVMFCSPAAAWHASQIPLKLHCTPLKLFLGRHEHINLWKRLLLSSVKSVVTLSLCFKKGHGLTKCPWANSVTSSSKSMAFDKNVPWTMNIHSMLHIHILLRLLQLLDYNEL